MLISMTGFGAARSVNDQMDIAVEIRALNNRYLKIATKCVEPYNVLEPEIEKLVRGTIRRGTVQVVLRLSREPVPEEFRLNQTAIESYLDQLRPLEQKAGTTVALGHVLSLPGVVQDDQAAGRDPTHDWPLVRPVVEEALKKLQAMRNEEGQAMRRELVEICQTIGQHLDQITERAPKVVEAFRDRLHERIRSLLADLDIEVDRAELMREVAIFAERSDITEEIVRLRSHLAQFRQVANGPESNGRKLEFLSQEMFREANTIGSKASDVEVSRHTVEIKGSIEKIREITQNLE